jgi:hypothetical protein
MVIVGSDCVLAQLCFLVELQDQTKNSGVSISFQYKRMTGQEFVLLFYTILHSLKYVKITRR